MRKFPLLLFSIAAGCATAPGDHTGRKFDNAARCDAGPAQALIGQDRNRAVDHEARRLSGAVIVRWIPFNAFVPQDYREDRLNLRRGPNGRIESISCG
jgi:hypothetical protein